MNKRTFSGPLLWALPVMAVMLASCARVAQPPVDATATTAVAKEIVNAAWMNGDFTREIKQAVTCQDIGILVTTRGYAQGEEVNLTIGEKDASKDRDVKLHGIVDADGKVRMRWPAMGCTDHVPSPLLGGDGDAPKAESRMPADVKHKAPLDLSPPPVALPRPAKR